MIGYHGILQDGDRERTPFLSRAPLPAADADVEGAFLPGRDELPGVSVVVNGSVVEDPASHGEEQLPSEVGTELDDLASFLKGGIGHLLPSMGDYVRQPRADDADPLLEEASAAYAELVAAHSRPAWVPVAHSGEEDHPVSKYFGAPWTADGVAWPRLRDRDALFVLQLDLASLPPRCPRVLGGRGLLQIFMADPEATGRGDDWIVRLARPHLRRGRNRVGPLPWSARPAVVSAWEEVLDVPDPADAVGLGIDPEAISRLSDEHGVPVEALGSIRGDKLRGWHPGRARRSEGEDAKRLVLYQMDAGPDRSGVASSPIPRGMLPGTGRVHLLVDPTGGDPPVVRPVRRP